MKKTIEYLKKSDMYNSIVNMINNGLNRDGFEILMITLLTGNNDLDKTYVAEANGLAMSALWDEMKDQEAEDTEDQNQEAEDLDQEDPIVWVVKTILKDVLDSIERKEEE